MISDKNDNAPFFLESSYKVTVPERQPDSNSPILTVVARDKDDGTSPVVSTNVSS
ncbi:hypothetical protein DPMN_169406 [Dreissena polymorpha]|uniref:Cadherin domain-containing protein n=1 Tax=Dreissena polymorpha TaxID=45954 RepID=A0A9D4DXQ0_DREPO|nr:hypothetical protein DPMN_169406 [Dreissena polymorpha]